MTSPISTALGCTNALGSTTGVTPLMANTLRRMHSPCYSDQPIHARALRNMRIHGESSFHSSGCHDICTVRNTRSGCGIRIEKRPSGVVNPATPLGEPLGLYG